MPYLDIGLVILIKQYNYILNEKKVKDRYHKHPAISLIIINIFKIIVERASKRYCGRPANRTTKGGIRDFGHVLQEGNISFLFISRWQRECTNFYITESNTTGITKALIIIQLILLTQIIIVQWKYAFFEQCSYI